MTKYLRYLVLVVIGIFLITVAMANREVVQLHAFPTDLQAVLGVDWVIQLPLFMVGFGGVVLGILIGFVWEWIREHKYRADAAAKTKELQRLERSVATPAHQDKVLALLEQPRKVS